MSIRQEAIKKTTAAPLGGRATPQPDLTLSSCDLALINAAHDDLHRLARALLLIWARANPITAAHPSQLPESLTACLSARLGIDLEGHAPCKNGPVFHHTDVKAVQSYLHLRSMTAEDTAQLRSFLAAQVPRTGNTLELIEAAYDWLASNEILRPTAKTVIQRLVYQVRHEAEERLFQNLADQLTQHQRDQLDELCQARQGRSTLATLVTPPHAASTDAIREEGRRLALLRSVLPEGIDWMDIQPPRLWQWAAIVRRLSAQALRRYPPAKRCALLLAFLTVRAPEITDAIVEMFDTLVARLFARSTAELREAQMEQAQTHLSSARLFRRITQVLLDARVPTHTVRDHIFQQISREQVTALVKRSESLEESEAEALFALLKNRFNQAHELARVALQTLHFSSPDARNPVLVGIQTWRVMDGEHRKKVPRDAPLDFVPQRWLRAVVGPDGIDRRAWELCLLYQIRQALRSGDLIVEGSQHYAQWSAALYPAADWCQQRATWFARRGLPEHAEDYLAQARAELHPLTTRAAEQLLDHPGLQIKAGQLTLAAQDRLQTPPATSALRRSLASLLPRVGLPQLLLDVDDWTSFTSAFDHLTARREPTAQHQEDIRAALLAVLVAEATNIGLTAMSAASGIPHGQLVRVSDWYLREETLQQAINMLIAFHQTLPLTGAFGPGTSSASHESEFARLISGPHAHYRSARGASSRKVTIYSHVSDQCTQFWVGLVNPLAQEASYALDGLVAQQLFPIQEHTADIPGGSDLLYGLFELLGYRLAPPLRDLSDQFMARAYDGASYGLLDPVLKHPIRDSLIISQWEPMNRLAASLKDQLVRPSLLIPRLQNMHEETALKQALQEVGRIARTRALLTLIADAAQLQRVLAGQHRCASLDALARAVFFGQQGRLSDRDAAAQLRRALALSLVINAIIVWNTRSLEAAAEESARRDQPVPDEMWPYLHPIMWEHIHLVGDYIFDQTRPPAGQNDGSHPAWCESDHAE
jgi:TnpA family transposase